jgi:UDP-glucose 4-epimerase
LGSLARVLIIGGAGFIGANLARACLARKDRVTILCRPTTSLGRLSDLNGDIAVERAHLTDRSALDRIIATHAPDEIYHLAQRTRRLPRDDLSDVTGAVSEDIMGLINAVAAASAVARPPRSFVRTGTIAEYGFGARAHRETDREAPRDAYGTASLACTHVLAMLAPRLPFSSTTARLALTYGPDQSLDFFVPKLIQSCLSRAPLQVRAPEDRRDLIHVDDVVAALLMIGEQPAARGRVINIATGVAPSVREVAQLVVEITQADASLLQFQPDSGRPPTELRSSPDLARSLLGWQAKLGLRDGLIKTIDALSQPRHSQIGAT